MTLASTLTKMARPTYDALIVGAGPAGLTAALGLGRIMRTAIVFDSQEYRNKGAGAMHMIPSRDGIAPQEFRRLSREETVAKYGDRIKFAKPGTKIVKVSKTAVAVADAVNGTAEGFEVADQDGNTWHGRKLVLATGSRDIMPETPGFAQCWPTNM
jgi:gliotoxin/aspirochlorine biosynthesis thioredoxin reductase